MIAFIIRRIGQSVAVMLAVGFIAFGLFNYIGDPLASMVGQDTSLIEREQLRHQLGLDDPFVMQFGRFLARASQGDFGISYQYARPVQQLLAERLPATLELAMVASVLALALGMPLGVYTGLHPDRWLSQTMMAGSLVGVSLPIFVTGPLLIWIFAVILGWLPSFGRGDVVHLGVWSTGLLTVSGIKALIMPAISLALFQMTFIMRLVRSEMLEVLRTDYIKFARARGLPGRIVNFGHALKNTLVPVITITGLQLGQIIAFSVVTETVFQWPGMGFLIVQAIGFADVPVMACYLMLVAFLFVSINLIVDLLYYAVDPRLRLDRATAHGH
jgi:ABC-type dipeptide/oligopeptide/nickel transport system permease component